MVTNGGEGGRFRADINVTPLVDVVLVLLIVFMVIVPLAQRGYDLDIPTASVAATPERAPKQVVLGISAAQCPILRPLGAGGLPAGCEVRVAGEAVAVADLARRMGEIFEARNPSERVLFLAADDEINYEGVMRIVDIATSTVEGLRIGLVTEHEPVQ